METNHPQPKSMRERILEKIDTRELSMRPKIYFTLKVAALVLITLAVLVISIFIFNFILFSSRINGHESLLGFGPRGILTFLEFFPWWLLGIDIALIILLEWLLRQFRFGYKSPVLYLLLTLLVVTASTAFLIDRGTAFNDQLLDRAEHHHLPPPLNNFYGEAHHHASPDSGLCTCIITAISQNSLTLRDTMSSTTLTVILPPNDPRATSTSLKVGDMVFVAGDIDHGVIRAFGLRKL
jgi:hypothetical protein